jgi:hypothetical protein
MGKTKCKITPTTDRVSALKGADAVLCTVFNGDIDIWEHEILIPKKYGIDIIEEYETLTLSIILIAMSWGVIQQYLPAFFQFEYLQRKYEKKLKDNPEEDNYKGPEEDNYKGDPLYRLINEED